VVEPTSLPEEFQVTATTDDGAIMGIRHKKFPLEGVQFHPEAVLTQYGHELLANFTQQCHNYSKELSYENN
jgi:anthranilate/para-aminobenzoate synthase component II